MQASYAWLYNSLDVMVRIRRIPSISSLTDAKPKKQVQLEINECLEKLRWEATREYLELSAHNMKNYIGGPIMVDTMFLMLQNDLDTGSKTIYRDVVEARVYFQKDTIKQFGDTIT